MTIRRACLLATVAGLLLTPSWVAGAEKAAEVYAAPDVETVRSSVVAWVASKGVSDRAVLEKVAALWSADEQRPAPDVLLDRVVASFALADPEVAQLVAACRLDSPSLSPPKAPVLERDKEAPFFLNNVRLYFARYLTQRRMYDEALEVFAKIDPKQVVDPASCFFYQAVCHHALLRKQDGLATLDRLLKDTEDVPVRFQRLGELMRYDLEGLREKSLDEIARKMGDSERRLSLGRGGPKVQKVHAEIIAGLDELIKKLEEQQGGGGGGGANGNRSNQSSSPAPDSVVKGSTAPGTADRKHLSKQGGWGDLPPKEKERILQLIDRMFPPHYKRAREEYTKKLAEHAARSAE